MKILALGDPHGILPKGISSIIKKEKIEVIVCVGDIGFAPEKPWLKESWKGVPKNKVERTYRGIVDKLCSYGLPVLTLRGNMFMTGNKWIADDILRKNKNLINKFTGKARAKGKNFVFFDVLSEDSSVHNFNGEKKGISKRRAKINMGKERRLNRLLGENSDPILICHNPPYGKVDVAYTGKHVGSKIIRDAIKKNQPRLVLCGHIHEAKGEAKIGKTKIYNLGHRGDYKIIDV